MSNSSDNEAPANKSDDKRPTFAPQPPAIIPSRPPIRTAVLDYEARIPAEPPPVSFAVQFVLGIIAPVPYTLLAAFFGGTIAATGLVPIEAVIWLAVAGYVALALLVRITWKWRAFIPGSLVTILALPVVLVGVCAMMLKGI